MTRQVHKWTRRLLPVLAAGVLLQAGGCTPSTLITGLLTTMASSVISQFIPGLFGLP